MIEIERTTVARAPMIELPPHALATTNAAIEGVAMMDETEAREYIKMMGWDLEAADQALTNFRARALDFADRRGWDALGYGGALEALQTELGAQHSKSYLSRILQAGEIERVLDLPIGQLPERTLRPLAQLDTPDQQRAAYQAVQGKPTAAKVQAAVNEIKPSAPVPVGWICERCGSRITDMKKPMNPICTQCAIQRQTERHAAPPPTLAELDALGMPVELHNAGYYWHSATPPTIAQNGSAWRGDAPTADGAIAAARDREKAKSGIAYITIPPFPTKDARALLRSIGAIVELAGYWQPEDRARASAAIGMLKAIGRKTLEATE